jgi:hypothetical protein
MALHGRYHSKTVFRWDYEVHTSSRSQMAQPGNRNDRKVYESSLWGSLDLSILGTFLVILLFYCMDPAGKDPSRLRSRPQKSSNPNKSMPFKRAIQVKAAAKPRESATNPMQGESMAVSKRKIKESTDRMVARMDEGVCLLITFSIVGVAAAEKKPDGANRAIPIQDCIPPMASKPMKMGIGKKSSNFHSLRR